MSSYLKLTLNSFQKVRKWKSNQNFELNLSQLYFQQTWFDWGHLTELKIIGQFINTKTLNKKLRLTWYSEARCPDWVASGVDDTHTTTFVDFQEHAYHIKAAVNFLLGWKKCFVYLQEYADHIKAPANFH